MCGEGMIGRSKGIECGEGVREGVRRRSRGRCVGGSEGRSEEE